MDDLAGDEHTEVLARESPKIERRKSDVIEDTRGRFLEPSAGGSSGCESTRFLIRVRTERLMTTPNQRGSLVDETPCRGDKNLNRV